MGLLSYFLAGIAGSVLNTFVSPYFMGYLTFIPGLILYPLVLGIWVMLAGIVIEKIIK
jgi:hypothetical protein